ncbi:unknown [Prevotella sp. CAG:1124]|nr:unknown [Prevotella sp. CAG:1124]
MHQLFHGVEHAFVARDDVFLVQTAEVEAVNLQRLFNQGECFVGASLLAQYRRLQRAGLVVVPVAYERAVNLVGSVFHAALHYGDLCACEVACILPCAVPCRLEEAVVSLVNLALVLQRQTEVVYRFAVVRVGVALHEHLDGRLQVSLGACEASLADVPQTQCVVVSYVERVAAQSLLVVFNGVVCSVAVLLEVQTCEVKLLGSLDFLGQQCCFGSVGDGSYVLGLAVPVQQFAAAGGDFECQVVEACAFHVDSLLEKSLGRDGHFLAVIYRAVIVAQRYVDSLCRRCEHLEGYVAVFAFLVDVHQQVFSGVLYNSQLAVGQEVLHERLFLIRLQPCEVGLVLGVDAGHQLDVRSVLVGKVAVPCAAEVAVTPCPLLLSWRYVVVGNVQHTGTCVVLVATLEVVLAVYGHVAGRHKDVLIVRDVNSGRVVHLVICARSDGERAYGALSVVEHCVDVWRENALVVVVYCHGGVGPPQECLRHFGAVVEHSLYLEVCVSGPESESCHALLVEHALHFAHPYRHASVAVFLYRAVNGHVGAGAVVLRPVEFDTSRNPWTGQSDQRRLDNVVVVDEVTLLNLVVSHLHTAAKLWQNHHLYIFVLDEHGVVFLVSLLVRY